MQKYHFLHFDSLDLLSLSVEAVSPCLYRIPEGFPCPSCPFAEVYSPTFLHLWASVFRYFLIRMVPELNTLKSSLSMGGCEHLMSLGFLVMSKDLHVEVHTALL